MHLTENIEVIQNAHVPMAHCNRLYDLLTPFLSPIRLSCTSRSHLIATLQVSTCAKYFDEFTARSLFF